MIKICTQLIFAICFLVSYSGFSQSTILNYPLTSNGEADYVDLNINASNFSSTAGGSLEHSSNGAYSIGWPLTAFPDPASYFEISFSPNVNYDINISEFNYGYFRSATGPESFELRYTKDGTYANSTLLDVVNAPSAVAQVGSLSGLDIDVMDGETIYFRWYAYDATGGGGTFRIDVNTTDLEVVGTVSTSLTNVFFDQTSATVNEGDGTVNIEVAIDNPDSSITSVDVVLISGNGALIDGFTSETVNFPSGSSANQIVTITITDDSICSGGISDLVFELQNATGASNPMVGFPDQFALSIFDNDQTAENTYTNDFEQNNLNGWQQGTDGDWTTSSTGAISGTYSLKHNLSGVSANSYITTSLDSLDLTDVSTTWRFQMKNGNWNPTSGNKFWVYLTSNETTLLPNGATNGGYAVGINVNLGGNSNLLSLYRVTSGGSVTSLITSTLLWNTDVDTVGIEVVRDEFGEWTLRYDDDGGFDNLITAGSATDLTFNTAIHFGAVFVCSSTRAGEFWVDDISITQDVCANTYYSQASGNFFDNLWDIQPAGTAGSAEFNRYNNFVVQNGNSVTLDADAEIKDFEVEAGASFDMDSAGHTLSLAGSFTNSGGTFAAGDGKVRFFQSGGNVDIVGSNSFFDLELDAPNKVVTLNSNTDLRGTLILNEGEMDINGNTFTLKSDDTNTAAVGLVNNGSVNGNVTVERYIQNGVTSWRNMGASVSGTTLQDWNAQFTTTGFPGADFPDWPSPANRFVSLKSYDETELGDREIGWKSPSNVTDIIQDGQGFWMYLGGSELPATVSNTGTLITGDQTLNLDYTPSLGAFHDGWNLVSNMYAATIDWDSPDFDRTNLEDAIWIWNQDVQQYGSYINGVGLHNVSNEIAHSQSFWVHADDDSPTLTFKESIKSNNNNADWIKSSSVIEQGIVRLRITGNGFYDETVVVFNDDATTAFEGTHDAMKFYSSNEEAPNLATVVMLDDEEIDLGINSMKLPEMQSLSIPLRTLVGQAGDYILSVHAIENVPSSSCLYVEDLETGDIMLVNEAEEMTVSLDTGMVAARFIIHVTAPVSVQKEDNICHGDNEGWIVAQGAGEGPWTYTWTDEADDVLKVTNNVFTADTLTGLPHGQYFVEVSGSDDVCGPRLENIMIFEGTPLNTPFTFEAPSCNEGNDGHVIVNLSGGTGEWTVVLMNDIMEQEINSEADAMIAFDDVASGVYILIATNECGTVEQIVSVFDENSVAADFTLTSEEITLQSGGVVSPINNSNNAVIYYWDMGDGSGYYTADVTHTYTVAGSYEITLYAINDYCEDMITKSLTVTDLSVGVAEVADKGLDVWFDGQHVVIEHPFEGQEMDLRVMNILGKTMMTTQSFASRTTLNVADAGYSPGVYFVHISINDEVITHKFVLNK